MPTLLAHRGAHARHPENTLAAFAAAMDQGADGVELDVRLTRTGEVVCFHDPTLARMADDPRPIAWLSRPDLARVDLGDGERVPRLDDALDLVLDRGGQVNVEAKGDVPDRMHLARRLCEVLRRRRPDERERILVSSFYPTLVLAVQARLPRMRAAWLFDGEHGGPRRTDALVRVLRPDGLHPRHDRIDADAVARWHARGLFVNAWTVNEPTEMRRLAAAGVDALITDDVPTALRILR